MSEKDLLTAVTRRDTPAALALIPTPPIFDARDRYGNTALHVACNHSLVIVVNALLRAGAPVNIRNRDGMTALMYAIYANSIEIARMLINAGADVGISEKDGWTALHRSCKRSIVTLHFKEHIDPGLAKLLLQAGCCPNPRTKIDLHTPLHFAAMAGAAETVAILLDAAPTCILDTDVNGWNALHHAAYYGWADCMKEIYARYKVIDAVTKNGIITCDSETALQLAVRRNRTEAIAMLDRLTYFVSRRLAFLAGTCLNPANLPATTRLASLPVDVLRLIVKKV